MHKARAPNFPGLVAGLALKLCENTCSALMYYVYLRRIFMVTWVVVFSFEGIFIFIRVELKPCTHLNELKDSNSKRIFTISALRSI